MALIVAGAVKVVAAVAVGALAAGGVALASTDDTTTATVVKVVDGDTIDVSYDGEPHRVRLLNIDTPESVDPDQAVECLGPEATEFLRDRLPVGATVELAHDEERYDGYGRELAGVFVGDDLINTEIARAGLGVAMSVAPNVRFHAAVESAQDEARSMRRGLYSEALECTVPGQVAELESAAETLAGPPPSGGAGLEPFDAQAADIAQAVALASAATGLLDGDRRALPLIAFTSAEIGRLSGRAATATQQIDVARSHNKAARAAEHARLEAAQRAAEEAARKAAEAEAARKAAEAEAARLAAEEAARQAAEAQRRRSPAGGGTSGSGSSSFGSSGSSSSSGGGGGYDGYTGCRAYGSGGTSVDEKGRPYTKIDCTTKQPIG